MISISKTYCSNGELKMSPKTTSRLLFVLLTLSLLLGSCATPTPVVETVIETVIVEVEGETVVITATPAPAPQPVVEEPAPVVVRFAHMTWLESGQKALDEAIAAFEADNPGIKIEQTIVSWGEAHSQFVTSLAAGVAPDIAMMGGSWPVEFQRMGAWAPGNEYLPADFIDRFIPAALYTVVYDDEFYGIPWEGATWGFFYRKDLFEAAGLDPNAPPTNWAEMLEYAQKLTVDLDNDGTIDQWGLEMPAAGWEPDDYFLPLLWQTGNPVAELTDAGWVSTIGNESGLQALQFYYDLTNTYNVMPKDIVGKTWEDVKNDFVFGKTAMMYNGGWAAGTIVDTAPEIDGKWATAPNPAGPGGFEAAMGYPNALMVTAQSQHKAEAWKFLEYLQTGDPSPADLYCLAHSSFNWTKAYAESDFANQPLIAPLAQMMNVSQNRPFAPDYEKFRNGYFNPGLQALIKGDITPEQAAASFDEAFNKIHGTQ
jgi:ABC-type glycerol-3-phosphate transport system substrate-binding protein